MRPAKILTALVLMTAACGRGHRGSPPPAPQPDEAARSALSTLSRLVTSDNYKALGFDTADEAKSATLQTPLPMRNVPLDALKAFKPTADPRDLLAEPVESLYPVAVNGEVRTGLTIQKGKDGFSPSGFGNFDMVRRVARYRQSTGGGGEVVVRIPAMNLTFLGRTLDNQLFLVPVVADPGYGWKEGQALPAARVFGQLAPLAANFDHLPI